jgi:hypothetical protein
VLAALPVFLAAGWPFAGWGLAAALWLGAQAFGFLLTRLSLGAGRLPSSAAAGFGMSFRALAVGIVLILVAVSNPTVALAAALLYVLAFTVELALSLISYFSAEPL